MYNGENTASSKTDVGKTVGTDTCKRMKLYYFLTPHTKVNSKWIKDLNGRHETVKLLEENIGKNLLSINISNFFLNASPQARETK